ncbi:MAG: FAD-binding oxidoreductase, partial [Verrucomicrobiaceae bacterium]
NLVPVEVHPSREIRAIAGLRPFRPPGFVVRREDRDGRILVHNYGHGGGGMTLSWGSSELAARLAGDVAGKECAVVGGGVMGLSTARLLQLRGAKVTLYTEALPPHTTSNVAGAQWWPFSVFDEARRTPEFGVQYVEAAHLSYRHFQTLVGPKWGVRWLPNYYLSDGPPLNGWIAGPGGVLHDLQIGFRDFGPGEHVFPAAYARRFHTMMIEPSVYLPELLAEVQSAGATVEIRRFSAGDEIWALPESVVFNCTGLGAGKLFGDTELVPIKGQLSFLLPQPEVEYNLLTSAHYMFPRSDGILLGGSYEKGKWDPVPDEAIRRQILASHQRLFDGMREIQRSLRPS